MADTKSVRFQTRTADGSRLINDFPVADFGKLRGLLRMVSGSTRIVTLINEQTGRAFETYEEAIAYLESE